MSRYEIPDDMPLDAMSLYMHGVKWTPDLSLEEETRLLQCVERGKIERSRRCPDVEVVAAATAARDRLVEGYQALVISIAKRWVSRFHSLDLLDLIQEGSEALLSAIEHFDVRAGCPLRAFAARCIGHAMWAAFCNLDRTIRLSDRTQKVCLRMWHTHHRLWSTLGREPTAREMAGELGLSEAKFHEMVRLAQCDKVQSLQVLLGAEDEEDRRAFVSVFETSSREETPRQQRVKESLHRAIETGLTLRQQEVVRLRYGLDGETEEWLMQWEVAERLGATEAAVEVAERRAKMRLRSVLAPVYLKDEEGLVA